MVHRSKILKPKATVMLAAFVIAAAGAAGVLVFPRSADAQSTNDLRQKIDSMEKQLKEVKKDLEATKQKAEEAQKQAKEEDNTSIKWHLGGYGNAGYSYTSGADTPNSFDGVGFNPIFLVGYKNLLLFQAELETSIDSEAHTDIGVEYANLNLNATDWLTLTAGRFLSPIGDFQQHLHPSWMNRLPSRPAGFAEDAGAEALTEVGAMARGAVPVGSMTADYAVYVGNGPRLSEDAGEGVLLEGFGSDNNDNKAVGGRVGLHPVPYVSVGVGGMHSRIKGNEGTGGGVSQGDYNLMDVDASYTKNSLNVRGEFIWAHLDGLTTALDPGDAPAPISGVTWYAWYAQVSYRMAGVTDNRILRNFEPVFRYSQYKVNGPDAFKESAERRWTVGLDYWFAPSIVGKAAYENHNFETKDDEDVFRLQIAFGF